MDPNKIIAALSPIATIVVGVFAIYFWLDGHYVHKEPDFKNLEQRITEIENRYVHKDPDFKNLEQRITEVESHYVHREPDFKNLEQLFKIKIKSDYIQQLNNRIWNLEDKLKKNNKDQTAVEELRTLKTDKEHAEDELKALRQEEDIHTFLQKIK